MRAEFCFGVNTPSRWGCQAPFTNITLDWTCPADLRDRAAVVGGREAAFTYGECQPEMDRINRAFLQVMLAGDANGRGFAYPIPTYNVTPDFVWDSDNARLLFEMTARYGTPYFQNFLNSDLRPEDVRSMCCRLRLDKRELRQRGGGLFGSDELTGSLGVVTLNLPRLGYLAASEKEFLTRLDALTDLAGESLTIKRREITRLTRDGLFPYTRHYLASFDNHFSTIGVVGLHETCLNLLGPGRGLATPEGKAFAQRVLAHLRGRLADLQERSGDLFNLEATPAESTSYRLALHDRRRYPDIVTSGGQDPYYTNSSQLPVDAGTDIFDALDHQESLQTQYTGGTVFHAFLGERLADGAQARDLVQAIARSYRVPYFTLSPTYSVCAQHGYLAGEVPVCPSCGAPAEVYSRIVGYYRALSHWNPGKAAEYRARTPYRPEGGTVKRPAAPVASWLLFTQDGCPRCPALRGRALELALPGQEYDVAGDEGYRAAETWNVTTTPTLILLDGNGAEQERIRT